MEIIMRQRDRERSRKLFYFIFLYDRRILTTLIRHR
jgi:hypothetical protein